MGPSIERIEVLLLIAAIVAMLARRLRPAVHGRAGAGGCRAGIPAVSLEYPSDQSADLRCVPAAPDLRGGDPDALAGSAPRSSRDFAAGDAWRSAVRRIDRDRAALADGLGLGAGAAAGRAAVGHRPGLGAGDVQGSGRAWSPAPAGGSRKLVQRRHGRRAVRG